MELELDEEVMRWFIRRRAVENLLAWACRSYNGQTNIPKSVPWVQDRPMRKEAPRTVDMTVQ